MTYRVMLLATAFCLSFVAGSAEAQKTGDPAQGKRLYGRCVACHTLDEGKHRVGPSLHGIFGAPAAAAKGYAYSASLVAAGKKGLKWDTETLVAYLADPRKFTQTYLGDPKATSKMLFRMPSEQQRQDAAYLPPQLAPKPSAATGSPTQPHHHGLPRTGPNASPSIAGPIKFSFPDGCSPAGLN